MDLRLHPCSVDPAEDHEKCGPNRPTAESSGETGLDMIQRDRDVAQQDRVRERLRDVRAALACAVAARNRPMNAH